MLRGMILFTKIRLPVSVFSVQERSDPSPFFSNQRAVQRHKFVHVRSAICIKNLKWSLLTNNCIQFQSNGSAFGYLSDLCVNGIVVEYTRNHY